MHQPTGTDQRLITYPGTTLPSLRKNGDSETDHRQGRRRLSLFLRMFLQALGACARLAFP